MFKDDSESEECVEIKRNNSLMLPLTEKDLSAVVEVFQALQPLGEDWAGVKLEVCLCRHCGLLCIV